jgi:uncharacterized protein with von Willebrand factor type A (vWA) domain
MDKNLPNPLFPHEGEVPNGEVPNDTNDNPIVFDPIWGWRNTAWLAKKKKRAFHYEADDTMTSYDYGFHRKTKDQNPYADYEKTGNWLGYNYYREATIDYRYIEQMANIFSAQADITVKTGDTWEIDLDTRTLKYNPMTLMFGTKADVVVALLHEIGHLRHTTRAEDIQASGKKILEQYPQSGFEVLNCFEDFRIDEIMRKSYAGSEDIYEANNEAVKKIAENYKAKSYNTRKEAEMTLASVEEFIRLDDVKQGNPAVSRIVSFFGITEAKAAVVKPFIEKLVAMPTREQQEFLAKVKTEIKNEGTLDDYLLGAILAAYHLSPDILPPRITPLLEATKHAIPSVMQATSTQAVADILEAEVLPVIEELLKEKETAMKALHDMMGEVATILMGRYKTKQEKTNQEVRYTGKRGGDMPTSWLNGDYETLHESVMSAVKELTRKLSVIKTNDVSLQWHTNLKRGKMNPKQLYRYPAGRYDFFKKKREVIDRTRNFAFSMIIDMSGSMSGKKAVHTARGTIILAEVFHHFNIPFEVVFFGSHASIEKTFDEPYTARIKQRVGGIVHARDDGTNMLRALRATTIGKRPERNRYAILLTDGDTMDSGTCAANVKKQEADGTRFIGLDMSGSNSLAEVIPHATKAVKDPHTLPVIFEELLKDVIKKLK